MFPVLRITSHALRRTASTRPFHFQRAAIVSQPFRTSLSRGNRRWATTDSSPISRTDLSETEALTALEEGTRALEELRLADAKAHYERSASIKRTPSALFNLGVVHYHLQEYEPAIKAWEESIELQPNSPDAHTNIANAYVVSPLMRPDLALKHLRIASELSPEDGEIAFNLGAVLEACGHLEEALEQYKRSKDGGIDRADMHARNVSAKILGKRIREQEKGSTDSQKSS